MKLSLSTFVLVFIFFNTNNLFANTNFFNDGLVFYEKKEYEKAKFKFEQDIVYNPKSEKSYLYLSKIFHEQEKFDEEKKNLNTVILLNPKNEEATFNLGKRKLKESDFRGRKKLVEQLLSFCDKFCVKGRKLKVDIENSLKK